MDEKIIWNNSEKKKILNHQEEIVWWNSTMKSSKMYKKKFKNLNCQKNFNEIQDSKKQKLSLYRSVYKQTLKQCQKSF